MLSDTRKDVIRKIEEYSTLMNLSDKRVLEVGIAGDAKPGGNYRFFGIKNRYETLDIDHRYEPDYIADIRNTDLQSNKFDLIILSQTIEHMTHPEEAIAECYRLLKPKGYIILDCPWNYPYHPEDDFEDYARYTHAGLEHMCREQGFNIVTSSLTENLASCLAKK